MAGTSSSRSEEFARVRSAESNNYNSGKSGIKSPMKPGFSKARSPKDPANTSKGTARP